MAADGKVCSEQFRGWLLKWTNYLKGWQRRWFVLSNGLLSYYRTQEEMAHTCRGTINLAGAFIDAIDATNFVITNGPSQVYHLRALNEIERQRWVTALELAKAKAIKNLESDDSDSESGPEDDGDNPLATLKEKLTELKTAHDLVVKNSHGLMKQLSDVEDTKLGRGDSPKVKEKLTLFKLTASAMVKAAGEFMVQAQSTDRRWSRALQHEHSLRLQLQENLEALANQMHGLESEARISVQNGIYRPQSSVSSMETLSMYSNDTSLVSHDTSMTSPILAAKSPLLTTATSGDRETSESVAVGVQGEESDEEDKFFDAPEISQEDWDRSMSEAGCEQFVPGHKRNVSGSSVNEAQSLLSPPEPEQLPISPERTMSIPVGAVPSFFENLQPTIKNRRKTIPPKPNHRLNLWSIMKNCIGRDLSRIPMPVNFNEPTSFLQRMVEDFIYADTILEKGAACESSLEELAYLAAFAVACYATIRTGKPFNPMLGETYECDRRAELGWRCFLEQVTHHPPMFAMHCEHKDWTLWEEYTVASKFRGKYVVCYPIGCCHFVFHKSGNHYTWTKVSTTIHNIIVGKLWVDQSGEMNIVNHTNGEECHLKFHAYSYFSREQQRKVNGTVNDASGTPRLALKGYWDQMMECSKIISGEGKNSVTGPPKLLWKINPPPQPGQEHGYGFSDFTCTLNEPEESVAPTDSRLRPDQRTMENGDIDGANKEKLRLEDKQRAKRRIREAAAAKAAEAVAAGDLEEAAQLEKEASYSPQWFKKEYDPLTNTMMHMYKGSYWEAKEKGDWDSLELPDIF